MMPLTQNIQVLLDELKKRMYGEGQPVTGRDIETLQTGPQENRGVFNIMQNLDLMGARRRMGARGLAQEDEDRALKKMLTEAQAENLRSLGQYRGESLLIKKQLADATQLRALAYQARSKAEVDAIAGKLEAMRKQAEAAMLSAEARMRSAVSSEEAARARLEFDKLKEAHDEMHANIRELQQWEALAVQRGWLSLGEKKAGPEMDRAEAEAGLARARTGQVEQATEQATEEAGIETAMKGFKALQAGTDVGAVTERGARTGGAPFAEKFGLGPVEPGWWQDFLEKYSPFRPSQEPLQKSVTPETPPTPATPPTRTPTEPPEEAKTVTLINTAGEEFKCTEAQAKSILSNPKVKGWKRK